MEDDEISAAWLPLGPEGRGVVIFTPALFGRGFGWQLSYDVPLGLWDPLRGTGLDVFRYDVRTIPLGYFGVRFVINGQARAVFVQERNNRGIAAEAEKNSDGWWEINWTCGGPAAAARYEWDIRVDWERNPQQPNRRIAPAITK